MRAGSDNHVGTVGGNAGGGVGQGETVCICAARCRVLGGEDDPAAAARAGERARGGVEGVGAREVVVGGYLHLGQVTALQDGVARVWLEDEDGGFVVEFELEQSSFLGRRGYAAVARGADVLGIVGCGLGLGGRDGNPVLITILAGIVHLVRIAAGEPAGHLELE